MDYAASWRSLRYLTGQPRPKTSSFVDTLERLQRAIAVAEALLRQHAYREAREALAPFISSVPVPLAGVVYELLGQCAVHGAGNDWPGLFNKARAAYAAQDDTHGVARVRLHLGAAWLARGDLQAAATTLDDALRGFDSHQDRRGQAAACSARAQVCLHRGQSGEAAKLLSRSVAVWAAIADEPAEALARVLRAQALALDGRASEASRDLLWAERLVGASATPGARVRVGLARAETLLEMGYPRRAVVCLRRLEEAVKGRGEPSAQAHLGRLLGQSLVQDDAIAARQALLEARELYAKLGQTYRVAQCDLALVLAEHRLGLRTEARQAGLDAYNFSAWPVLQTERQRVRQALRRRAGGGVQPP
ncbi:MAG TPA: hypothetical protein VFH51_07025, partial [Myxococcota bacterium]|nr:hypothetical protein [Myxococcota bacterium]